MKRVLVLLLLILPCYGATTKKPPQKGLVLKSIAVIPSSANILAGQTYQFRAVGTYSNGNTRDITSNCTWSSSDATIAVVNNLGLATGMSSGGISITASLNNIAGQSILVINTIQHSVGLSWTASTGEASANVYRSMVSGTNYIKIGNAVGTSFNDENVLSGVNYYYVVTAVNSSGAESNFSNEAEASIP